MVKDCLVCREHLHMTVHHFHWPKSDIRVWYPKMFAQLRAVKLLVCDTCHHDYHDYAWKHCVNNPNRKCYECQYAVICCYWKREEE